MYVNHNSSFCIIADSKVYLVIFFLCTRFRSLLLLCLFFLSFLIIFFSSCLHMLISFMTVPPSHSVSPCHLCSCLVSLLLPTTSMQAGSCSSLAKIHNQWWWLFGTIMFWSRKLALSNGVIVHPLSVVISVAINNRHYFRNSLICYNCFHLYSSCLHTHTQPLHFFLCILIRLLHIIGLQLLSHFSYLHIYPYMGVSCKYIEWVVADRKQGVVLQLGGWAWG
jgi:hypothetical protein